MTEEIGSCSICRCIIYKDEFFINENNSLYCPDCFHEKELELVNEAMKKLDFELEQTGGGCTAFEKVIERDGKLFVVMITVDDGADAPRSLSDSVVVGYYNISEDTNEEMKIKEYKSLKEYIEEN